MVDRLLLPAMVLVAILLTAATPVSAQNIPDSGTATPVPGHPGFERTDDGLLILEGDMVIAKCGSVQRTDYTSTALYDEVVEICTESASSQGNARASGAPMSRSSLPETGGLSFVYLSIVLLSGAGFAGRMVVTPWTK